MPHATAIILIFLCYTQWSFLPHVEKDHIEVFFQRLSLEGGTWEAENPAAETTDFTRFRMEFTADGQYSVRAKVKGIRANGDTLQFWDIWEFPDPSLQNTTVLVQRSGSAYGIGRSEFPSDDLRKGELEYTFYNGSRIKQQDTHQFISQDTLISTSRDYEAHNKSWGPVTRLTWIRQ